MHSLQGMELLDLKLFKLSIWLVTPLLSLLFLSGFASGSRLTTRKLTDHSGH